MKNIFILGIILFSLLCIGCTKFVIPIFEPTQIKNPPIYYGENDDRLSTKAKNIEYDDFIFSNWANRSSEMLWLDDNLIVVGDAHMYIVYDVSSEKLSSIDELLLDEEKIANYFSKYYLQYGWDIPYCSSSEESRKKRKRLIFSYKSEQSADIINIRYCKLIEQIYTDSQGNEQVIEWSTPSSRCRYSDSSDYGYCLSSTVAFLTEDGKYMVIGGTIVNVKTGRFYPAPFLQEGWWFLSPRALQVALNPSLDKLAILWKKGGKHFIEILDYSFNFKNTVDG